MSFKIFYYLTFLIAIGLAENDSLNGKFILNICWNYNLKFKLKELRIVGRFESPIITTLLTQINECIVEPNESDAPYTLTVSYFTNQMNTINSVQVRLNSGLTITTLNVLSVMRQDDAFYFYVPKILNRQSLEIHATTTDINRGKFTGVIQKRLNNLIDCN